MAQNPASSTSLLRQEYDQAAELLRVQPPLTQRFVEAQARHLADAIVQRTPQVRFTLPDQVIGLGSDARPVVVPAGYREQVVGGTGFLDRFSRTDVRKAIVHRLQELELMSNREVSISAKLLRYATVIYMVHGMLPAGRSVKRTCDTRCTIASARWRACASTKRCVNGGWARSSSAACSYSWRSKLVGEAGF